MRVFRNREEAEKAGLLVTHGNPSYAVEPGNPQGVAIVRTPLEAQLAEALEAVEWSARGRGGLRGCPSCGGLLKGSGHDDDCKLSAALRAFRGEAPATSTAASGPSGSTTEPVNPKIAS